MKHHKLFHTALLVSIQERREQFPEMTDADAVKALRVLADSVQANIDRQRVRDHAARPLDEVLAELRLNRKGRSRADVKAHQERMAALAQERMAAQVRLEKERRARAQEREAQRELSLRMIDMSFKTLAKELHPDKGGSREKMARLNRARAHLKQMA